MRKRCRSRTKTPGPRKLNTYTRMVAHFAYIQPSEHWAEWRFRLISHRQAAQLVAAGEAEAIYRMKAEVAPGPGAIERCIDAGQMEIVGYRALSPTSWERPSPCTLTMATLIAVGNAAVGDTCDQELTRRQRAEVVKFKVWPLIGDTKAVAVRPRISDSDRRMAESLLAPRLKQAA